MSLVSELRRRNVFRMAVLYAVTAWLIMQAAEVVIALAHLPDWIGPTTLGLLAVGFPIALIFSWFYEMTPEGISLESDIDAGTSITHVTGRRMDLLVISLLTAAVILFAYDKWWMPEPPDHSIAVLPFVNMSDDPDQEYFSDGISEELLNVLAKIPGLRVVARSSSFQFKGENRDIVDIGHQLNVAHVLEGSVRKAGGQLRITAQLIDASDGFHLWSDTYDRELANIFAVQDEISAAIVGALKEHLGLQVAAVPRVIAAANIEAHEAYLRGQYLVRERASLEGAVRELEKAIALDPEYALAHAELAMAFLLMDRNVHGDLTVTESIAKAAPHAKRAMALDPNLAEAHAATGFVLWKQGNLEEALTHFEQAIRINPNYSIVYVWMASVSGGHLGRYAEGFTAIETALHLNPLSTPATYNYIQSLINRNRLDEADRELEKVAAIAPAVYAMVSGFRTSVGGKRANRVLAGLDALRLSPEWVFGRSELTRPFAAIGLGKEALAISEAPRPEILRMLGRPGDAVTTAQARLAEDPDSLGARGALGLALASAGDYALAWPILEEMWQRSGERVTLSGLFEINTAAALINIRRDAGEEPGAGELIAAIKDNVRRYREAGISRSKLQFSADYEDGLAAYLAGDRERGLALIAKGLEDGYFIPPREAYLQALYDDPGFAPIRASQEARQTRERKRFLDIVCNDNPYAIFWQPAEGTCERFTAADEN